jgi:hypothetical protein
VFIGVRLCLTMPSVVLERLGPGRAIARSWSLTTGSFWRLFGIKLLTYIIIFLAIFIIELPFGLAGGGVVFAGGITKVSTETTTVIILSALGAIVASTIMDPMKCGVTVLLYLDLRMRREGLDLALQNAAQGNQLTGEEFATIWRPPGGGQWPQPGQAGQWSGQGQWSQPGQPAQPGQWSQPGQWTQAPQPPQPTQWTQRPQAPQQPQPGQWAQAPQPPQWPQQPPQQNQPPQWPGEWPAQDPRP